MNRTTRRARELMKNWKAACDCGGDSSHPGWHHPGCAIESYWEAAVSQAEDEQAEEGPTDSELTHLFGEDGGGR